MPQPAQQRSLNVAVEGLQPHEIELQRKRALLAKVRTMREGWITNKGKIDSKDPKKEYVWVNMHEERRSWYEGMEYIVVKSKVETTADGKIKVLAGPVTQWVRADGTHRRGDLILYEIDRELKEALEIDGDLRAVEQMESAKEGFKAFAERENVPYHG